jgi:hypothetical protein
MFTRRALLTGSAVSIVTAAVPPGWALAGSAMSYDEAIAKTWATLRGDGGLNELVRYATLAANSHNTQPWRFRVEQRRISILPDFSRRCPVVDPDDHHLFASLGCAAENLVHAAGAAGFKATPVFSEGDYAAVALEPSAVLRTDLFEAIPHRQCVRAEYDGQAITPEQVRSLEQAGRSDGVSVLMIADRPEIEKILEYVVQGNSAQMRDPAFMNELKAWIRFNDASALATMDGLSARSSGNPSLPSWLAGFLLPFVLSERSENDKYSKQLRSSSGIAVFVSERDDKAHWFEAGRACQRFALKATALGLKYAFVNQPVEVPELRSQLMTHLAIGDRRPDLIVRFGRGPELPKSLRRPVDQVAIVAGNGRAAD